MSFLNYKRKSSAPANKHLAEYMILYWPIRTWSTQCGPQTTAGGYLAPVKELVLGHKSTMPLNSLFQLNICIFF